MKKILLFSLMFYFAALSYSQTTLLYPQRMGNYYSKYTDGGDFFDETTNNFQVGSWAHNGANKQTVMWRKFRTDASGGTTSDRALQIGDEFVVTLSATQAYGQIGFALLASPSSTANWDDRKSNYALLVNIDGPSYTGDGSYGKWYIQYQGDNTSPSTMGGGTSFVDYTITMLLTAKDRMNITISNGTSTDYFFDVQLNSSNSITDYSIYLQDDYNSSYHANVYWGLGAEVTQHKLTNTGNVSIGSSNSSFSISSVISDGFDANSSVTVSPNSVSKVGLGTLTLSGNNTYTGATTINGGTLELENNLSNSDITVKNGATLSINGADITVKSITVESGGIVKVLAGKSLTVTGNVLNNGTFTLVSDGTGKPAANPTGSLIVNGTCTGDITIDREIDGHNNVADQGWHYISSPVDNFDVNASNVKPGANDDLYYYDESTDIWKNYKASTFNLVKEKGYLCAYETSEVKSFTGTINNSDVAVNGLTNTSGGNGTEDGWNLIGNPFTSAVAWNNGSWALSNIAGTAKVWPGSGNWDDIVANGIIPAMNGFMVQVSTAGTGSLTIPASARTHDATPWYKNTSETLKLKVSGGTNSFYDYARIKFNESATNEYDMDYDSHKLFGLATAPQLFTKMGDENYSTNSFNYERSNKTVDLAFRAGTDGEYTIEVVLNTLDIPDGVYLEDLAENVTIDLLKNNSYTFTATAGDNENRFKLHFGATGIENMAVTNLQAYMNGQNLMILGEEGSAQLSIFDIQGKQVMAEQVELTGDFRKALNLPAGIYVVSLQTKDMMKTNKIIIK